MHPHPHPHPGAEAVSGAKHLIERGDFKLHSGYVSSWRINAEALDEATLEAIVQTAVGVLRPFGRVVGIPRGGIRIAEVFKRYVQSDDYPHRTLIVDDVLTSGRSMEQERKSRLQSRIQTQPTVEGFVLFARTQDLPIWVRAFFTCNWWLR